MIANSRQIEEHQPLDRTELQFLLFGQTFQVGIVRRVDWRAAQIVVPVRTGLHVDLLAVDHRNRFGRRLIGAFRCVEQVLIVVGPRLVVVVHAGHVRVVEDVGTIFALPIDLI